MVQACRGGNEHIDDERGDEERQQATAGLCAFAARIEGGIVPSTAHPARRNKEALRKPVTAPPPSS
jgi:hypothetical protein